MSWTTTTCLFPLSVGGRSMTSIPRIWNGHETGIGWSGGFKRLTVPDTIEHSAQDFVYVTMTLNIPFHHQCRNNAEYERCPEKYPSNRLECVSSVVAALEPLPSFDVRALGLHNREFHQQQRIVLLLVWICVPLHCQVIVYCSQHSQKSLWYRGPFVLLQNHQGRAVSQFGYWVVTVAP